MVDSSKSKCDCGGSCGGTCGDSSSGCSCANEDKTLDKKVSNITLGDSFYPSISVDKDGIPQQNLTELAQKMSNFAIDNYKLRYSDIKFHIVNLDMLTRVIAAHGWPVYPDSWELQQSYEIQKMGHEWGNWIVYEIVALSGVLNKQGKPKEPFEAFIYDADSLTDTKLVISHVFGHAHVGQNNSFGLLNSPASPYNMMVEQKKKYDMYYDFFGIEKVTEFIDAVSAISTMVPIYPDWNTRDDIAFADPENFELAPDKNPWTTMMKGDRRAKIMDMMLKSRGDKTLWPGRNVYDLFRILEQSPELEPWQKDIVKMEHERQGFLHKVGGLQKVHEGFASFVDLRFGAEASEFISNEEVMKYLKHRTNGFAHPQYGVNPYGLGFNLLYNVAKRWDKGKFGVEFDLCEDAILRKNWDKGTGKGWDKVLEIVRDCTDYDLMQLYFDENFFNKYGNQFVVFEDQHYFSDWYDVTEYIALSREYQRVKQAFLFGSCNAGLPFFYVAPGAANYKGRGELFINHDISGIPELFDVDKEALTLEPTDLEGVLRGLHVLWKKPIHIKTIDEKGEDLVINYNGKKFSEEKYKPGKHGGY